MTTLQTAVTNYLRSGNPARGTRTEYQTTLRKWQEWNGQVPLEKLGRKEIADFLDWVYERAVAEEGTNPGRTANKAREQLRAVIAWAWDQEVIDSLPRFPKRRQQRDIAGRHYLTKAEINALYFSTHKMRRPRGWNHLMPLASIGVVPWSYFSTMDSIPELSLNRSLITNLCCGVMYHGIASRQMDRPKKGCLGAGSFIAG